ncbi:MAG: family 20 glycosylhydrolase [Victivallales bacterium]|nr:family 20 glycosylhydrolase [Victivallales bacterium]
MAKFFWQHNEVTPELNRLLLNLAAEFPLASGDGDTELVFQPGLTGNCVRITRDRNKAFIAYGTLNAAARGVGLALAGLETSDRMVFDSLGIMLDCSQSATMTIPHLKQWLRRLALMGYNQALLYTEDTYELPDEPYFGYMRGAYSMAEMKEIDAFARELGIEMIACIQTLGHMQQILQWEAYDQIRDTSSVMLVDEPATYALIEKMLAFWSEAFASRRIHIGMDETHDLGRGKFLDRFGYERKFDIFNRHLAQVRTICRRFGLKPMIWSDMYFRMGNEDSDYYRLDTVIPDDVKAEIPSDVQLVYWDYYHEDKAFYADWIQRHRDLAHEPIMASGVWGWSRLWYDHDKTLRAVRPCLEACTESRVREVFFTLWCDDGGYGEFDSCMAGFCWAADLAFGGGDEARAARMFPVIVGGDYAACTAAGAMELYRGEDGFGATAMLLWDDPMLGKRYLELEKMAPGSMTKAVEHFHLLAQRLAASRQDRVWADLNHGYLTARLMELKLAAMGAMFAAYDRNDRAALQEVKERMIPAVLDVLRDFAASFRSQWLRRNCPFGLDTMQVRLGGMIARWEEAAQRLDDYLNGRVAAIPELAADLAGDRALAGGGWYLKWYSSSSSVIP